MATVLVFSYPCSAKSRFAASKMRSWEDTVELPLVVMLRNSSLMTIRTVVTRLSREVAAQRKNWPKDPEPEARTNCFSIVIPLCDAIGSKKIRPPIWRARLRPVRAGLLCRRGLFRWGCLGRSGLLDRRAGASFLDDLVDQLVE